MFTCNSNCSHYFDCAIWYENSDEHKQASGRILDLPFLSFTLTLSLGFLLNVSFQLWREVIDGLVSHSLLLRSLLGMPEKDTYAETVAEEQGKLEVLTGYGSITEFGRKGVHACVKPN